MENELQFHSLILIYPPEELRYDWRHFEVSICKLNDCKLNSFKGFKTVIPKMVI